MFFVAEQLRGIMARLGARTVDELVGRADLLKAKEGASLDLSELTGFSQNSHHIGGREYDFKLDSRADANFAGSEIHLHNTDRSFGTLLGAERLRAGEKDARVIRASGCGGQSFGAFLPEGVTLVLSGEANDYLAKGLSGGTIAVRPPEGAEWKPEDALIGNVALYGATGGAVFVAGTAGERFCVRNSGAIAVAEGVGDHGCEYMTGGRAAILGPVGDNFAAGMSGGIAYVYDPEDALDARLNRAMVDELPVAGTYAQELRDILERHAEMTGSVRVRALIDDYDAALPKFKMIIPTEYRRLLEGR